MDSIIQRTITEFKDNVITRVGFYAFRGCRELVSVDLPNVTKISQEAFEDCGALMSVNFPAATITGYGSFMVCAALKDVNFPALTNLGETTFQSCKALVSVDLPSVVGIGHSAFKGCTTLSALILRSESSVCRLAMTSAFDSTPISSASGYIYVPKLLIEDYKVATNWSTYADQFRALEDYTVDGTVTGELDESKI